MMGIIGLTNLATIISAVLGGGSLLLQILPFLQLKGQYESLRVALQGIRSSQDERFQTMYGNEDDWLQLVKWLDRGEVIVGPIRRRVVRRAVIAAAAAVTLIATTLLDIPNLPGVNGKLGALEWPDLVALILVAIGPRLAFFKRWLLTEAEAKFLINLHDLEEAFYRREVAPKIEVFNAVFARQFSHVQGSSVAELALLRTDLDALNKRVAALAANKEILQTDQFPGPDGVQLSSISDGSSLVGKQLNRIPQAEDV